MTHIARQSAQEGPYRTAPLHPATLVQLDAVEPALWPILPELGYHGIFPKPGAIYHRQPCPHCSPWRVKSDEKCLVVMIDRKTSAWVVCHHCGFQERIHA
jgi:predicted RNA-binding Zn-ribbon protein involved in translation (DUF1610 family)